MNDTVLVVLGIFSIVVILSGFAGYMVNTNKIIKEQEKEIAQLRTALKRHEQRETLYIIKDGRKPQFGEF